MNYTGGGALAATGTATIAGIAFDQLWLIAGAFIIVGMAAVWMRIGFRRNKGVSAR